MDGEVSPWWVAMRPEGRREMVETGLDATLDDMLDDNAYEAELGAPIDVK